jgi:predicted metal-binding protein
VKLHSMMSKKRFENLAQEAVALGASASAIVLSRDIRVEDKLAALCNGEYTCPNYGLAASCPPHVAGPVQFRKWQENSRYSIVVKIELPSSVMFSDERNGVMQLLHQIVATIEQRAVSMGFAESKAFAGGSCKSLFCEDQKNCSVVTEKKPCRNPESARPSMSGFGIDVIQLMKSSGWSAEKADASNSKAPDDTTWVSGLILIA